MQIVRLLLFYTILALAATAVCAQDTIVIPRQGSGGFITSCDGMLTDDGGEGNYTDTVNGYVTIVAPAWNTVSLYFSEFSMEPVFDYIRIYDGPGLASPLLGTYSGTQLQGQTISSGGMYLTVQQVTDDVYNLAGFKASWQCLLGNESIDQPETVIFPNPAGETLNILSPANFFEFYTILDLAGQQVMSGAGTTVATGGLQPGIYFLFLHGQQHQLLADPKTFVKY